MNQKLIGNVLVMQSGETTSVMNSSLTGIIAESLNYDFINEIYGSLNGIEGILNENLIDLAEESQQTIRALRHTPGASLGTSEYKIKNSQELNRILEVFKIHNIRYFFCIGGNESQNNAYQIDKLAKNNKYDLRVIGIPQAIDNELPITDHCPGYGSTIKYISTIIQEIQHDNESNNNNPLVSIIEVMGRNSGWIAAGSSLAKSNHDFVLKAPHLIYLPEVIFLKSKFIEDVKKVLKQNLHCIIVVSEGIKDEYNNYIFCKSITKNGSENQELGGVGSYLQEFIEKEIKITTKLIVLGNSQRSAVHMSSKTDNDESYMAGKNAVKNATSKEESGLMITLLRTDSEQYACETGTILLKKIVNETKIIPAHWINDSGTSMNSNFFQYASPLIQGQANHIDNKGIMCFSRLKKYIVPKLLNNFILN